MEQTKVQSSDAAAWGAFAACCAIWGSTFLVISIGNDTVPALWAATLRFALASVLLLVIARVTHTPLPRGPALRSAAQYGFFSMGINFALLYWGERVVPSGLTALLFATLPLTTAVIAAAFGMERLSLQRIAGGFVALIGVLVIFSHEIGTALPIVPLVAVALAATSAGLGSVLLKRGPRQASIGVNVVGSGIGLVVCLLASFALGERHAMPLRVEEWGPILYLTLLGSIGAYVLYAWLLNRWSVGRLSFLSVIVPIVALGLGGAVRHERLTLASLCGTVVVLGGVTLGLMAPRGASSGTPADGDAH
jgi:drug/metabolite transporter (DMT)-like permease